MEQVVEKPKSTRRRRSWLREAVIADLVVNGPVVDSKGRAVILLAERMGHHSAMSVGNIVRELQLEGNLIRVQGKHDGVSLDTDGNPSIHRRRSYEVRLTDEFLAEVAPQFMPNPEPERDVTAEDEGSEVTSAAETAGAEVPDREGDFQPPEGLDYDLLAQAVLGIVWNNLTASADVQELRQLRQELEETKAALAEAKVVIGALGADLKEERKQRGKVEDEAAALSAKVEELEFKLKGGGRNNGWDKMPVDAYKELDKIMRAVPTARG